MPESKLTKTSRKIKSKIKQTKEDLNTADSIIDDLTGISTFLYLWWVIQIGCDRFNVSFFILVTRYQKAKITNEPKEQQHTFASKWVHRKTDFGQHSTNQ